METLSLSSFSKATLVLTFSQIWRAVCVHWEASASHPLVASYPFTSVAADLTIDLFVLDSHRHDFDRQHI